MNYRVGFFRPRWAGFSAWDASLGIWTGLMLVALSLVLIFWPGLEVDTLTGWQALSFLVSGLFLAVMSRTLSVWSHFKPGIRKHPIGRSMEEHQAVQQGFRELFIYAYSACFLITAIAFSHTRGEPIIASNYSLNGNWSAVQIGMLLGCLILSFVPLSIAFLLQAKAEQEVFQRKIFRSDAIAPSSFWIGTIVLGAIMSLAAWAADTSFKQSTSQGEVIANNLSYWITFAVVALFVAFIFLPHLQRFIDYLVEREKDPLAPKQSTPFPISAPATAASWIDSLLVRLVAPLTGATQHGPLVPHGFVILSLLPLTALGFVLPQPYGLAPIALGTLMIFALGRRWAWIEEDRELASRLLRTDSDDIQIGFENDLKDEALLGYAFLFILVPLALHQINGIVGAFQGVNGDPISEPFFAWLSFFGSELAKAVPFVDWWEIYQVQFDPPVKPVENNALASHLTFASRAMVDLVIMAALLQAIGIWQRSRAQEKLYNSGQIDAFDPFTEERFFQRGMRKAQDGYHPRLKFEERIEQHITNRSALNLPTSPYNPRRLGELILHPDKEIRAGARWMIDSYDVLAGNPVQRLNQLATQWHQAWHTSNKNHALPVKYSSRKDQTIWRRTEKLRLEPLLEEFFFSGQEDLSVQIGRKEVKNLVQIAILANSEFEFVFARVRIMEILGAAAREPSAFWALAAQVLPQRRLAFSRWEDLIQAEFGKTVLDANQEYISLRHGRAKMRALAYEQIEELSNSFEDDDPFLRVMHDFLTQIDNMPTNGNGQGETQAAAPALKHAIEVIGSSIRRSEENSASLEKADSKTPDTHKTRTP